MGKGWCEQSSPAAPRLAGTGDTQRDPPRGPGGKPGWISVLPTRSLLALKANRCNHLNYMIGSLIQYNQAHCLRVEHLAETLSQPCSNLAGEELILTISTFSFSIEYERNQVNFC